MENISQNGSADSGMETCVKTKVLLENVRNLGTLPLSSLNADIPANLCAGKDLIIEGRANDSTFIPLLVGIVEKLTQGYDNNIALLIAANTKQSAAISELAKKLTLGTDVKVAELGNKKNSIEIDSRLFIGTFDSVVRLMNGKEFQAEEVALVAIPQLDSLLKDFSLEDFEEVFSILPKKPVTVITANGQISEVVSFTKKYLANPDKISLMGNNNMTEHSYIEVGSDVLDKTNALCDILETAASDGVLVYCNSDSDTDLVQVILRKRGFEVERILSERAEWNSSNPADVMKKVANKEISAVITNDSGISSIDFENFDTIVHYGVAEPSAYQSRMGGDAQSSKLAKVISIVGPLDFTGFHLLKKSAGVELNQKPLPSKSDVLAAKVNKLTQAAERVDFMNDERMVEIVKQINANPKRDAILGMLLHNTMTVLPELKKAKEVARPARREPREDDYQDSGSYREGNGRRERGNYRDDREEGRDGGRRGRGRDRFQSRGEQGEGRSFGRNRRDDDRPRSNEGDMEGSSSDEGMSFEARRQEAPPKKDIRFYIGTGSKDGLTKEAFSALVAEHTGLADSEVKRFTLRNRYSFVDFAEEHAPAIIEKLAGATTKSGSPLLVKKATIISAPRERSSMSESNEMDSSGDDSAPMSSDDSGDESMDNEGDGFNA
jgi:ATP-dependent RNA helicase DeaD